MNDSLIQAMPPALLVEIETLRDQRDLYRSLLLSELEPLAACMTHALETVERIRAALRMTTRDDGAFRGKIERLQGELNSLEQAMVGLHLPSVSSRVVSAQATLQAIEQRADISGNDLLPAMVTLEELCSHLLSPPIAPPCICRRATTTMPKRSSRQCSSARRPNSSPPSQQLSDKFATEQGKRVAPGDDGPGGHSRTLGQHAVRSARPAAA